MRTCFSGLASIGADARDSVEERTRRSLLVSIVILVFPAGVLWGALYWVSGERIPALLPWGYSVLSVLTLGVFAMTRSYAFLRGTQLGLILGTPWLLMLALGGITPSSGVILWSFIAPLVAVALGAGRHAWPWMVAFVVLLVTGIPLAPLVRTDPTNLPQAMVLAFGALNIGTVALITFVVLVAFAEQRREAQARVHDLLVNVLPHDIADRLSEDRRASIADQHAEASVLFADVVDFTPMSGRMPAHDVVGMLDHLFSDFDDLVDACGLEKIKTIGDAYMVAAGVPVARDDHAHALAHLALDMRDVAGRHARDDGTPLELRIGISSGPVVAGVIGRRRFLYDLWGDAVNTASRMESHGVPGQIQVTRATYELLRDEFDLEPRGVIDVKGKGPMQTWFLKGVRARGTARCCAR